MDLAVCHACVIRNYLRVMWNVHMLFFERIQGNGKKPIICVFMLYAFDFKLLQSWSTKQEKKDC